MKIKDTWKTSDDQQVIELDVDNYAVMAASYGYRLCVSNRLDGLQIIETPTSEQSQLLTDAIEVIQECMVDDYMMLNIAGYMDDDIREKLNSELSPCSNEDFLYAYNQLDSEFQGLMDSEFPHIKAWETKYQLTDGNQQWEFNTFEQAEELREDIIYNIGEEGEDFSHLKIIEVGRSYP